MVLAVFGGGAVVRRVIGVGAQGGAWAPVIDVSELPARLPLLNFLLNPLLSEWCGQLGHRTVAVG